MTLCRRIILIFTRNAVGLRFFTWFMDKMFYISYHSGRPEQLVQSGSISNKWSGVLQTLIDYTNIRYVYVYINKAEYYNSNNSSVDVLMCVFHYALKSLIAIKLKYIIPRNHFLFRCGVFWLIIAKENHPKYSIFHLLRIFWVVRRKDKKFRCSHYFWQSKNYGVNRWNVIIISYTG